MPGMVIKTQTERSPCQETQSGIGIGQHLFFSGTTCERNLNCELQHSASSLV
jgi:hypothetical protein